MGDSSIRLILDLGLTLFYSICEQFLSFNHKKSYLNYQFKNLK